MDRESRFFDFPPEEDDIDGAVRALLAASKQVLKARAEVRELFDRASRFPAIGPERAKGALLTRLRMLSQRYEAMADELNELSSSTTEVRHDLIAAFHSPETKIAADDPRWRST